jgi:hypothetical protein
LSDLRQREILSEVYAKALVLSRKKWINVAPYNALRPTYPDWSNCTSATNRMSKLKPDRKDDVVPVLRIRPTASTRPSNNGFRTPEANAERLPPLAFAGTLKA